jgi:hypothetical protein
MIVAMASCKIVFMKLPPGLMGAHFCAELISDDSQEAGGKEQRPINETHVFLFGHLSGRAGEAIPPPSDGLDTYMGQDDTYYVMACIVHPNELQGELDPNELQGELDQLGHEVCERMLGPSGHVCLGRGLWYPEREPLEDQVIQSPLTEASGLDDQTARTAQSACTAQLGHT